MEHEQKIRIDRSIEAVFAYVTDPGNLPEWDADIRRARQVSAGQMRTGAEIELERTVPPFRRVATFTGRVTEHVPPASFAVSVDAGPLPFDVHYGLVDVGGATDLWVRVRSRPRGLRWMVEPIVAAAIHRQVAAHYEQLKRVLERQQPTGRG